MWIGQEPKVAILYGRNGTGLPEANIYIVNYDILAAWLMELTGKGFKTVIVDESHFIKGQSQRTKAVKGLCKGVSNVLMLSGTPIVNRPMEAYNTLNILAPEHFPSRFKYGLRYCAGYQSRWGWDFTGASNTDELNKKLIDTVMIRRRKEDVLKDLPEKVHAVVPMEISNRSEYRKAQEDFVLWLREKGEKVRAESASRAETLATVEGLKQLTIKGKLDACLEWIESALEQDNKLLTFMNHKLAVDAVMARFGDKAVKVDGSVVGDDRQVAVDRFQTDDTVRLFVGNIKAAGAGLTLTAATHIAFLEFPWAPGDVDQCISRAYARVNNLHGINVWYLIAKDTIEERICKLLDDKRKVLGRVLDGKTSGADEQGIFEALLAALKE
jgi:SWI/SNF-related matrix-associated actin-dependent regulator 1 of chromatin subfamily A